MSCTSTITNAEILALLFVIAPQFQTTDPVKLAAYNLLIDALRCQVNIRLLGCCALLALANLLAHYLTLQLNPNLGITTNLSEGQLSIGFANTVGSGNFFYATAYGQAYSQIIGNFKVGALVTNTGRFGFGGWRGPSCCGY